MGGQSLIPLDWTGPRPLLSGGYRRCHHLSPPRCEVKGERTGLRRQ